MKISFTSSMANVHRDGGMGFWDSDEAHIKVDCINSILLRRSNCLGNCTPFTHHFDILRKGKECMARVSFCTV